jgi:AraC family transcriptional regulator
VRGRSDIPFLDAASGRPLDALAGARIVTSSSGLGWADVHVEVGRNGAWEVDDVSVAQHYLALNTDDVPLRFEAKFGGVFRTTVMAPGELWFCPSGESFSHRVPVASGFALVTLEPAKLVRVVEDDQVELRRTYGVARPQLEHMVRALAAEAERGGPGGGLFVDALATALAVQLVDAFGTRDAVPSKGAPRLGRVALRRVLEQVDARLGVGVPVEELARVAGLSASRFTRAFKASTGESPYQFVMHRRLEEARRALDVRDPDILNVALRFGFSDQAHFTRLFKRRFGLPPGRFVRERLQ